MFKIEDTAAPTITCPADMSVDCSEDGAPDPINSGSALANDNCDSPTLTFIDGDSVGDCSADQG